MTVTVACAQYPIGRFDSVAAWQAHVAGWVDRAVQQDARILLFPEYGAMELTSLLPPALQQDLTGQIAALQDYHEAFVATWAALAKTHDVHIVAPSFPLRVGPVFRNRACVIAPDGRVDFQEKRQMTRFEAESWIIAGGAALKVFDAAINGATLRFGVTVCYDVEFPLIAQAMAAAGAELILVPSCTDTLAGAHRVTVGARARALENQVYVATAPTVGEARWSPAVDVNVGWAGVYAAPDRGLPDDGVLVQGVLNEPGWVFATLDFERLRAARVDAQVFTAKDWPGQVLPSLAVTTVSLT
jgi:predicted amidohydrolase